jgi:hypothetical protein
MNYLRQIAFKEVIFLSFIIILNEILFRVEILNN